MWYINFGLLISALVLSTQGLPLENTVTTTANPSTTPSPSTVSLATTIGNPSTTTPAIKTASSSVEKPGSATEKPSTSAPPKETTTAHVDKILGTTEKPQPAKPESSNATTLKTPTSSSEPIFITGENHATEKPHSSCCSGKTTEANLPIETISPVEDSNGASQRLHCQAPNSDNSTTDMSPYLRIIYLKNVLRTIISKVIVFRGICGPDGCKVKGDIYDEFPPLLSR